MQNSILRENLLTLSEAADFLPRRNGKKIHTSTIFRWCKKKRGLRGVNLEFVRFGSIIYTSEEALERFGRRLAEAYEDEQPANSRAAQPHASAAAHRAVTSSDERVLDEAGI